MKFNINHIPTTAGVYIYKDKTNKIIYVGKAINLRKRVSQYFTSSQALGPKTKTLVSQISQIDFRPLDSEVEALVLESSLIKKYRPKYNSQLTDDKNYLYICISKDKYPRLFTSRLTKLDQSKHYIYGPFPDSSSANYLLKTIRSIFPFRTFVKHSKNCLDCHLGLCPGPNPNLVSYRQNISQIKKILHGHIRQLLDQLQIDMYRQSANLNYELASIRKKQIESLVYITTSWKNIGHLTSQINLPSETWQSALNEIKAILNLANLPSRIEAYDISNSFHFFVGSMVVFQNGQVDHSAYRQFKIKTISSQDDQAMMAEIVARRLTHPSWPLPTIILVDGGKPQISAVFPLLKSTQIILLGLAKKEETIINFHQQHWQEIKLPQHSHALRLLMHLRDEAHRFANRYRRQLIKQSSV